MLARLKGDGAGAGECGELVERREAGAVVADLGEKLRGVHGAGSGKGLDDGCIGMLLELLGDELLDLADLHDERAEHGYHGSHHPTRCLRLHLAGAAGRSSLQAGEEFGGRPAAAVARAFEKAGHAYFAQAGSALRGGELVQEGQADQAVDVGEDRGGARPEAFRVAGLRAGRG